MGSTLWVDATAGVAGDMLAGALIDAGVPADVLIDAVRAVLPEVTISVQSVERAGLVATKFTVHEAPTDAHRHLADIRALLAAQHLSEDVRTMAQLVFERLADIEAAAHGIDVADVHFHEVGAADSIADIVSVCAGLHHLGCDELLFSLVELGHGTVRAAHGELPVPTPAALRLSSGLAVSATGAGECATPTGLALLTALGTQATSMPSMRIDATGCGAGTRDHADRANVVRVVLGHLVDDHVLAEANIDDMDPRLWPRVLELLMSAGASDVWLTPILMKKGRPAHTLSILCTRSQLSVLQDVVFEHTSTIGMRIIDIEKSALERMFVSVDVAGEAIAVKLAGRGNRIVNVSIEFEDVARVARVQQRAERAVLEDAQAAAATAGYVVGGVFERD